jgi:diguanylate cyclase (GGDEF)-like protein
MTSNKKILSLSSRNQNASPAGEWSFSQQLPDLAAALILVGLFWALGNIHLAITSLVVFALIEALRLIAAMLVSEHKGVWSKVTDLVLDFVSGVFWGAAFAFLLHADGDIPAALSATPFVIVLGTGLIRYSGRPLRAAVFAVPAFLAPVSLLALAQEEVPWSQISLLMVTFVLFVWTSHALPGRRDEDKGGLRSKDLALALNRRAEMFDLLLEGADRSILVLDSTLDIMFWNDRFSRQVGPATRLKPGLSYKSLLEDFAELEGYSEEEKALHLSRYLDPLLSDQEDGHFRDECMDHSGLIYSMQGLRTADESWVLTYTDITEGRKAAADAVIHMSHHDSLTGLPNRTKLRRDLARSLVRAREKGRGVGVMAVDINDFKSVNDAMGHEFGDALLIDVARTLREIAGETAIVARSAADEFAVVLPDSSEHEHRVLGQIIGDAVRATRVVQGRTIRVAASIGIASFPKDGEGPERLLRSANVALHHAQREGRDTIVHYEKWLSEEAETRTQLEHDILHSLDQDHFSLYYQPQINIATNELVGMEALLRWNHPERGWISPADFVAVAELSKLIIPLTEKLLDVACRQAVSWQEMGLPSFRVAFNLSPYHIRSGGVDVLVEQVLKDTGLSAQSLELEITESTMAADNDLVLETLTRLDKLGVTLAIDDFGTGYSSMAQLRQLPVDLIKVDRSFVDEMTVDKGAAAIVNTVIRLAHTLGHKVIAEGIEARDQLDQLNDLGCDFGQGYLIARPMPAEEVAGWVRAEGWKSLGGSSEEEPARAATSP